jgi:hypothetical protein
LTASSRFEAEARVMEGLMRINGVGANRLIVQVQYFTGDDVVGGGRDSPRGSELAATLKPRIVVFGFQSIRFSVIFA